MFDRCLNFNNHLDKISCKALKMLGFTLRILVGFKLSSSLKVLYSSFVRSILEYGSHLESPYFIKGIYQLEWIQHKFLKYTSSDFQLIATLADQWIKVNLTFISKLIDGRIDSPVLLNKLNFRIPLFNSDIFLFHAPFCSMNYLLIVLRFEWWG